jgi:hypothetical protein
MAAGRRWLGETDVVFLHRICAARLSRLPLFLAFAGVLVACQPTVKVEAPKEPITINLNITADVRVRIEEQAKEDIKENPEIF